MFITINLKGLESVHQDEPSYNRLYDRWDSINKVNVPRGTLKLMKINSKDVASYEVNNYTSNSEAIIDNYQKINF